MKTPERNALLNALRARFEGNMQRHQDIAWANVQAKLEGNAGALKSLAALEATGGEPDVIGYNAAVDRYVFCDCSTESPLGRRSLCYDRAALDARKENKPKDNVLDVAAALGVDLLNEEQYRHLQMLGRFDTKTSSWISTPPDVRTRGGALFGDRRYSRVFVYHNGAESYYAARGFRGSLQV